MTATPPKQCFAPNCQRLGQGNIKKHYLVPLDEHTRTLCFKAVGRSDLEQAPKFLFSCPHHHAIMKTQVLQTFDSNAKEQQTNFLAKMKIPSEPAVPHNPIEVTLVHKICRLCLRAPKPANEHMIGVFGQETVVLAGKRQFVSVKLLIETFTGLPKSQLKDTIFPQQICRDCFRNLCVMNTFRQNCQQSNATLNELLWKPANDAGELMANRKSYALSEIKSERSSASMSRVPVAKPPEIVPDLELVKIDPSDTCVPDILPSANAVHEEKVDVMPLECRNGPVIPYLKRVKCPVCLQIVDSREELKYHQKSGHGREHAYKCVVKRCKLKFKTVESLQCHHEQKHCHDGSDEFVCELCNRPFALRRGLTAHMEWHGEPKYQCEVCDKKLRTKRTVIKHMLVHNSERNFICDFCSKAFQTPYALRVHVRLHTNEKPYICHMCAEAFTVKCSLNLHIQKYHPDETIVKPERVQIF